MISKSEIAKKTIGAESLYVLEKSGAAIFKEPDVDVEFAMRLLSSYQDGFTKLKQEIDQSNIYDNSYFDYEFETLLFAIKKLIALLSQERTPEQNIEASIYQQHIRKQDDDIRQAIEDAEGNNH